MTDEIRKRLALLQSTINYMLDGIHNEALRKFRALAKSTGQRTRVDRVKK